MAERNGKQRDVLRPYGALQFPVEGDELTPNQVAEEVQSYLRSRGRLDGEHMVKWQERQLGIIRLVVAGYGRRTAFLADYRTTVSDGRQVCQVRVSTVRER